MRTPHPRPALRLDRFALAGALLALGILALGILATGVPALADGGGGGDEPKRGATATPEDPAYTEGVKAIKAGQYGRAIPLLDGVVAKDAKNADALNWLAYATRKNGDPAKSISIYEKALAVDPKHKGAHEYIGEAYLALDNLPKAKEHLARLNSLCFFSCSEYKDLKKAVEAYESSGGKVKPAAAGR
jgi:tetratricopeptide (TPR) repeat protein